MRETSDELFHRTARLRAGAKGLEMEALLAGARRDRVLSLQREAANLRKLASFAARGSDAPNRN